MVSLLLAMNEAWLVVAPKIRYRSALIETYRRIGQSNCLSNVESGKKDFHANQ